MVQELLCIKAITEEATKNSQVDLVKLIKQNIREELFHTFEKHTESDFIKDHPFHCTIKELKGEKRPDWDYTKEEPFYPGNRYFEGRLIYKEGAIK